MNTEFKASYFKSMEELLDTIETWLRNEEYYGTLYDDFNRFFDTGAMEEMYYYIKQLKEENKKLKQMVNFGGITIVNCPECNKEINVNFCRETEEYRKKYQELKDRVEKARIFVQQNIRDIDYDCEEYDYLMELLGNEVNE